MITENITDLIGNTPLIELFKGGEAKIFGKLESANPGGSVKDRLALALIKDGEKRGFINQNTHIIEPTSGNTGIGLAMICTTKGYKLTLTMPESVSIERRKLIAAYGANIELTPAKLGMKGAIERASELAAAQSNSYIPFQFENPTNSEMHRNSTGPEIWNGSNHSVDIFVAGVGTGGTITGVGEFLKAQNPNIKIVAVEPAESPVLSGGVAGPHKIQGIGAGFVPKVLNMNIIDSIEVVTGEEAFRFARKLAQDSGVLCGISSGAAAAAAYKESLKEENRGKNIIFVVCDTGERYLSTELFG